MGVNVSKKSPKIFIETYFFHKTESLNYSLSLTQTHTVRLFPSMVLLVSVVRRWSMSTSSPSAARESTLPSNYSEFPLEFWSCKVWIWNTLNSSCCHSAMQSLQCATLMKCYSYHDVKFQMFLFFTHPLGMPEPPFPQDEEVSPSNPFLEEEEASRRDARSLERALDMLMVTTSRRCPRESDSDSFFKIIYYYFKLHSCFL